MRLKEGNLFSNLKKATAEHEIRSCDVLDEEYAEVLQDQGFKVEPECVLIPEAQKNAYHLYLMKYKFHSEHGYLESIQTARKAFKIEDYLKNDKLLNHLQNLWSKVTVIHDPTVGMEVKYEKTKDTLELQKLKEEYFELTGKQSTSKKPDYVRRQIERIKSKDIKTSSSDTVNMIDYEN